MAAIALVASGVAAVSAYEAHLINVRSHVELAMNVPRAPLDFGTVFPEEWMLKEFTVQTSGSFCNEFQTRVGDIEYEVWVEWKPLESGPGYYNWLGEALYVGIDAANKTPVAAGGDLVLVGAAPATQPGAKKVLDGGVLRKFGDPPNIPIDMDDLITVGLDVPDFEGYVNELTDPNPKPSGLDAPSWIIPANYPGFNPQGMNFGLDLKIQVTFIGNLP